MQEDGVISPSDMQQALAQSPQPIAYDASRRDPDFPDTGFYAADHVAREAKSEAGIDLDSQNYTVRTTLRTDLLRATESALQDGLARYEAEMGRAQFQSAEANISDAVQRLETQRQSASPANTRIPAWQEALDLARLPLYDVHWDIALVLPRAAGFERGTGLRVGLRDGRTLPLAAPADRTQLKPYDVVFVHIRDDKGNKTAKAELRVRPVVQGAALVLENKTGRILAMTGGFSHAASQLNRVTQTRRQPGSTFKPISYLAALGAGLQPNTLVRDSPITLAPIVNSMKHREEDYWSPKNYDRGRSDVLTLRRALENSRNRVTAHLLDGAISRNPVESLDRVCKIAQDAQLYQECQRYYPFVLGAQPVRMIDLAAFFAAIANEGKRPTPYAIDSIEKDGETIHRNQPRLVPVGDASPGTFYQLKTILQGVVERGTARSIQELAPFVAGKTGTTEDENDAWFVGFTNDVTIAVWVGYDNADGQRHTLGSGQTGARVALPIFAAIVEATWAHYVPRTPLNPPSAEAQQQLVDMPIDLASGELLRKGRHAFMEHFRRGPDGEVEDTRYQLVPRRESIVRRRHPSHSAPSIATNPDHWLWNNDRNSIGSKPATPPRGGACIFCPFNSPYP
jgi:membrane carboxypeptidase/penicillin-binding protein